MENDLNFWIDFFSQTKPDLESFSKSLETKDCYFLNHKHIADFDDPNYGIFYDTGFLEQDINFILKDEDEDSYYKNRLAIAFSKDININSYATSHSKKDYLKLLELIFVFGKYNNLGIESETLIQKMIINLSLPKNYLFDFCFLRGLELSKEENL